MNNALTIIIKYLDVAAPLFCLLFAIFRKEKRLGEHTFIVIYILGQFLFNGWAKIYMHMKISNGFIYQINCTVSLVILTIYFLLNFYAGTNKKAFYILAAISLLSVITAFTIATIENAAAFNSHSYGFVAVIISLYASIYYYLKLTNPRVAKITTTRSFWFITGLFCYYSGAFFVVATYRFFIQYRPDENFTFLWSIHNVIVLLMCISFSIGFRCQNYQVT